jgi:hypothetical protein
MLAGGSIDSKVPTDFGKADGACKPRVLWVHSSMLDERLRKVLKAVKWPEDVAQVKKALWTEAGRNIPQHAPISDRIELFNKFIKIILAQCKESFPADC